MEIKGVFPVFQTPYLENELIDWETLEKEIDWLLVNGADGVVMAMVSEVLRLDRDERRQMVEAVVKYSAGRGAVIISVGAESSRIAEENTRHAEASGAQAVMAIPPVSIAVGEAQLIAYYHRIVNSCKIPVVVQDASGYDIRPISIAIQDQRPKSSAPETHFSGPSEFSSSPKPPRSARGCRNSAMRPLDEPAFSKAPAVSLCWIAFVAASWALCQEPT